MIRPEQLNPTIMKYVVSIITVILPQVVTITDSKRGAYSMGNHEMHHGRCEA